jgi:outer membrane immunogenic protein
VKKILLGGFALAALIAAPAMAADLPPHPQVYQAPPLVVVVYNWTGFYIGGNLGYARGRSNANTDPAFFPIGYFDATSTAAISALGAQSLNSNGFTGGVQGGYNWQAGWAVFGFEADFNYLGTTGSATASGIYPCCAPTGFTVATSISSTWLLTARPRVGFAVDNWLFYATGGLAVAQLKGNFVFSDTFATAAESALLSATKVGWTAGAGFEVGFGYWSLRAEYLYVNLGTASVTSTNLTAFAPPISFPTNVFTNSVDLKANIVRVGVNYRFGGPVYANY